MASGNLGVDLDGLSIVGTADVEYYRKGTTVPGTLLTLPEIGSSNNLSEEIEKEDSEIKSTEEEHSEIESSIDTENSNIELTAEKELNTTRMRSNRSKKLKTQYDTDTIFTRKIQSI